jgi:hypothetical protein
MNKAFYIVLFVSIALVLSASVAYLIIRKPPPPQPFSNQQGFTQIYTPRPGGRVFTSGENCDPDGIRFNIANYYCSF